MLRSFRIAAAFVLGGLATSVTSQGLPPIPADLMNVAAVVCVKIDSHGVIAGAFLIGSTGDLPKDREIVEWVKQLRWPPASPGEKLRNVWFPMPFAIGQARAPAPPSRCSPPKRDRRRNRSSDAS